MQISFSTSVRVIKLEKRPIIIRSFDTITFKEFILLTTKNRPQMGTAYNVGINGVYYGYGGRLEYPGPLHLDWHYVQAVH